MQTKGRGMEGTTGTQSAFQSRMEAQCKQIDQYRLRVMQGEGRDLSQNQAALEWIDLYADSFIPHSDAI
jgi:tryptophan synthase alpha subunit